MTLESDFNLTPVVACEIEFTLHGSHDRDLSCFWREVTDRCEQGGIAIFKIEKERGHEQHEVALAPASAEKAAADCIRLKEILSEMAVVHGMRADFSAKPFPPSTLPPQAGGEKNSEPGSGLHVHVHLADSEGNNVFYKDDARISDALKYSLGGLLHWMIPHMPIFAPTAESYLRFQYAGDHTPTTVSWGANNRTCALRLPDALPGHKHIEHRVAGADAGPEKVIAAILEAMHWGILNKAEPGPQIYGDAKLEMYGLPSLLSSRTL